MIDPLRVNLHWRFDENPCIGLGSGEAEIFKALFMLKVTGSRSKVALESDHDVA